MKSLKYFLSIAALTGALTLSASATFIVDTHPGGEKLFIDVANKNVSDFQGVVWANNSSAPHVGIRSGFANIKPIKDGSLTELTFTPAVVPDSGPTAMLLGVGLAAIVLVRRYLKR